MMASYVYDDTDEKQQTTTSIPYFEEEYSAEHSFKIFVGIDFGTYGSGLAYALQDGQTYIHNLWRDVDATEKPKTSVLFDNNKEVQCHGNQAVMQYISSMSNDGWALFERFKMHLYKDPDWKGSVQHIRHNVNKVDIKDEIQSTNDPSIT